MDLTGRTLGDFVLREPLGQGGFGTVYRAEQPLLEREVVVKVLSTKLSQTDQAVQRFLGEARLASRLDHPYAAHVYAFGAEADGVLWIAMERVRGTPLDELLGARKRLPLLRFVALLERICEVVQTAHDQGIVHRDLKPANVIVIARAGKLLPKLIDFGIAKVTGEPEPTQRGRAMGSPHYMAPEQWIDAAKADHRTDLYALAILAYECLTGRLPFPGDVLMQVAKGHARDAVPILGDGLPPGLDGVFARALAKRPADRFQSALEMAAAFRAASGAEPDELPQLEEGVRADAIAEAPQPIAEAVAGVEAAATPAQARAAVAHAARTIARWLGVLAVAARSRAGPGEGDPPRALELLGALRRDGLASEGWLELAVALTAPWRPRRDAHPLPELVALLDGPAVATATTLLEIAAGDGAPLDVVQRALPELARLLGALAPLAEYVLVVPRAGTAEAWMGVRRPSRRAVTVREALPDGQPALVDREGGAVASLWPIVQALRPTPGAPEELFFLEGRGRHGARLVAPLGLDRSFERQDEALWAWYRTHLVAGDDDEGGPAAEERPPYRGLNAFTRDDADLFFGREREAEAFANRLRVTPFLAVVGPSGAGKSSFVQAGVLPRLPPTWRAIVVRPGATPLATLAARLRQDAAGETTVLVVDQFEEILTLCLDPEERLRYARALADAPRVVVTLRDDFLIRVQQLAPLRERFGQGLELLGTPAADDLRRILELPARRAGYEFEDPALVEEMVRDVADQPGALALLSFTASRLWELRDRHFRRLPRKAYEALGGVGGALAQHAEDTLAALAEEDHPRVREAFRHLVTAEGTRATLPRRELEQLLGAAGARVLEKLIGARLLLASEGEGGEDRIEVIHEALLTTWPRLVRWQREDAENARLRDQLRAAARQWAERGRPRGLLWRGEALMEYRLWRGRWPGAVTETEDAFGAASVADEARGRRWRRGLSAAAFVVLAIGVVGLWALSQRAERSAGESRRRLIGLYAEQGRQELLDGRALRASVYLAEAYQAGGDKPLLQFLLGRALGTVEQQVATLAHDKEVRAVAFSPDGARLASGSEDGVIRLWDGRDGRPLGEARAGDKPVRSIVFAEDGARFAAAGDDGIVRVFAKDGALVAKLPGHRAVVRAMARGPGGLLASASEDGTVRLWDLGRAAPVATLEAHEGGAIRVAFAEDGRLASGGAKGDVRIFGADHRPVHTFAAHEGRVSAIAFSPDGKRLLTGGLDGVARLWDAERGAAAGDLLGHAGPITALAFSPDGARAATASYDTTARVWNLATLRQERVLSGHRGRVMAVAWTRAGDRLATASQDTTGRLWDAATGKALVVFEGHTAEVVQLALAPDDARVATAGLDATARLWSAESHGQRRALLGHEGSVHSVEWSADGARVVTAGADGTVRIWDAGDGRAIRTIAAHPKPAWHAVFSPDGALVASAGEDGSARVFRVADGSLVRSFDENGGGAGRVRFADGGRTLVVGGDDGAIRFFDVESGRLLRAPHVHQGAVWGLSFDGAGARLASASEDGGTIVTEASTGRVVFSTEATIGMNTAAMDAPGRRVASGGYDMRVKIFDVASGTMSASLDGHTSAIVTADFSPDGLRVVTSSFDGTAGIWDAATGELLALLDGHAGNLMYASFSPDGRRVATASDDGSARLWDVPLETRSPAEVARLLRCRVPYRLVDGRVLPARPDTCTP